MKKFAVILLGMIFSTLVVSGTDHLPKSQALYIYNFLKYIEWPDDDVKKEYVIGVIGDAEVARELKTLTNGRNVSSKSIRILSSTNRTELSKCQIIFIPKERTSYLTSLSSEVKGSGCLTVFENTTQESSSASIDLFSSDGKLVYRINHEIARAQNIIISQVLINMASL